MMTEEEVREWTFVKQQYDNRTENHSHDYNESRKCLDQDYTSELAKLDDKKRRFLAEWRDAKRSLQDLYSSRVRELNAQLKEKQRYNERERQSCYANWKRLHGIENSPNGRLSGEAKSTGAELSGEAKNTGAEE